MTAPADTEDETEAACGQRPILRLRAGVWSETDDTLVMEEPLEIRVDDRRFTVTMRTPGADYDLARGLLFAEGVIRSASDIAVLRYCDDGDDDAPNLLSVRLRTSPESERQWQRNLISGTSCGLCGKAAIGAVRGAIPPVGGSAPIAAATLLSLPRKLRERQILFERTGGLHAAGLFDADGACRAAAEDIGRHNATDKVIGRGLAEGWLPWEPASGPLALLVSGRTSFEIVQKAAVAGIPVIGSVSAASTLAVDLAEECGQTLLGFLRDAAMTVYTGAHRVRK